MKKGILLVVLAAVVLFSGTVHAKDQQIISNTCDTPLNGMMLGEGSPDQSTYYQTGTEAVSLPGWGKELQTSCYWEADVKFTQEGAGFSLMSRDGTRTGTCVRALDRDGTFTMAIDGGTGSYFIWYLPLDKDTWYHVKLMGRYGAPDGMIDMVVDTYAPDGSIAATNTYYVILMNDMYASSGVGPEYIRVEPNTCIDNVTVTGLWADEISIKTPAQMMIKGDSMRLGIEATRQGAAFSDPMDVVYTLTDLQNNPVSAEEASIQDGVLVTSGQTTLDAVRIHAAAGELSAQMDISLTSGDAFEIVQAVFDEEYTQLLEIKAKKQFFCPDSAEAVCMIFDADNNLCQVTTKQLHTALMTLGENTIAMNLSLPEGFDVNSWKVKLGIWAVGEDALELNQTKLTLDQEPILENDRLLLPVRSLMEALGGHVEWMADTRTVVAVAADQTVVLQIDHSLAFTSGEQQELDAAARIIDDRTYVPARFVSEALGAEITYENGIVILETK